MPQFIVPAIMGGSALAGVFANKKGARTGTQSSTSTITRNLLPEQQSVLGPLSQQIMQMMTNPSAGLAPLKSQAIQGVNKTYAGMPDRIMESLNARGFGKSGLAPSALTRMELGRAGDIAGLEPKFAQLSLNQQNLGAALAQQLLGQNFSTTQTGNGTYTNPGSATAGGLTGGLSMLMALMSMGSGDDEG